MTAVAMPEIRAFFDEPPNTVSYLVWDPATKDGVVIDPVLNFDHRSGEATVESADAMLAEAKKLGVNFKQVWRRTRTPTTCQVRPHLKLKTGATVQSAFMDVQRNFRPVFNAGRVGRRFGVRPSVPGRRT
jgi:hypothetical protein